MEPSCTDNLLYNIYGMHHATVALGQRLTKPPRALLEDFEQKLIEYDRDKEKYERLSQTKMGELA